MKKIFTLMWAVVCVALTIVSCTPDNGDDNNGGVTYTSKITVSGAPEANLAPEAGEFTLNYAIENPTLTDALEVTTEATWLKVGEIGAETILFTYEANTEAPGTPAREAVIVFAYKGAESVSVTVKQESQAPSFAVEFLNVTPQMAQYVCTPVDNEMLYLLASSQDLSQFGIQGETPQELMKNYAEMLAMYGMLTGEADGWFVFKGATTEMPKDATRWSAEDTVTVFALGLSATVGEMDPETGMPAITIDYLTPVHAWEVPFLPYPTLTIPEAQLTQNVSSAAGEIVLDCVLENALSGGEVTFDTEATWVHPTWADNKLTIAYDANTVATARRAKINVGYGDYVRPLEVTVMQEKSTEAQPVTELKLTINGTTFNGIYVNVESSNADVVYALKEIPYAEDINWMDESENLLGTKNEQIFHKGNLTNYFIKTNVANYDTYGLDRYVYAVAVEATSEEKTNYAGQPYTQWNVTQILSDVVSEKVTIDTTEMPVVTWDVEKSGLVWNGDDRYDLNVVAGSTVVLYFNVEHPAEGASLKVNGTSLYDEYNVVDGEPVIDNVAGTITFKIDAFDTSMDYHYVEPGFKYTNAEDDMWNIMLPSLRLTQVQSNDVVLEATQIQSLLGNGYYLADGTAQDVTNEATWLKWAVSGVDFEACKVLYNNYEDQAVYNGLFQFQGDASNVAKQGFLGNATGEKEVKQVVIETYSSYATPSFNLYYGDAKLPQDAAKVLAAADNCVKGEKVGTTVSGSNTYDVHSFTCTFDIPAGHKFVAVRNDSKGATYIKNITIKY